MPGGKRNKHKKRPTNATTAAAVAPTKISTSSPKSLMENDLSVKLQEISFGKDKDNINNDEKDNDEASCSAPSNDKYKIAYSDIYGRYLIAKRDLKPGEILIKEAPLVIGPCVSSEPVCLGCYKPVTLQSAQYRCENCHWPICNRNCPGLYQLFGHTIQECELLKRECTANELWGCSATSEALKNLYELILIVRILLKKQHDIGTYRKIFIMESHLEERKKIPKLWQHYEENVVKRLRNQWHLEADCSAEEIHMICGILDVNCFEIGQNSAKARTLYPSAFLLAHNCCPNTAHTDQPETYEIILRTSRKIHKNDAITLSYAYTLQGTLKRREFMQAGKLFWCACERCRDPYELGTDCSALICASCKQSSVRSIEPLNQTAEWRCSSCSFTLQSSEVVNLLDKIDNDLEAIDAHDVPNLENFLIRYCKILPSSHYLMLSAKYSLCQIYGRIDGYLLNNMSLEDLKRKEKYCREFLQVVNKLEPGLTRLRGLIMYELHAPIMMIAQYLMAQNLIKRSEFNNHIKEVIQLLRESSRIMLMEPQGSKEHEMGLAALAALKEMGIK